MRSMALVVFVLGSIATVCAQETERKFNIYGYIDLSTTKLFVDDSHILWTTGRDDLFDIWLSHLNIYGDWKPAPGFRVLSEMRLTAYPDNTGQEVGTVVETRVRINGFAIDTTTVDTVNYPVPPIENTVTDDHDGPTKWGSIVLERAWMEYAFNSYFALRAGKFITPAGIWNVDHGSPAVLSVRQPYQTNVFRLFPRSQTGLMVYGSLFAGNTDIDYTLYVSSGREELRLEDISDLSVGGDIEARLGVLVAAQFNVYGYTGMRTNREPWRRISIDAQVDPAIRWRLDSTGTIIGIDTAATTAATDSLVRYVADSLGRAMDNHTYAYYQTSEAREICLGVSGKFSLKSVTLQGEFNYQQQRNYMANSALTHILGYYGMISYRIPIGKNLSLTPYVMAERLRAIDSENNPQEMFDGTFLDGFVTVLGGLNLKAFGVGTIKLEYGYIRMNTLGEFAKYEDLYDMHLINAQLSVAF